MMMMLRTFWKRPLFTLSVVGILGLGVGATTAVFSVVNALLLSPLPYPDEERLVRISKNDLQRGWAHYPILFREFETWKEATETLETLAALRYTGTSKGAVTVDGVHHTAQQLDVTWNYFDVLGVTALFGRTFTEEDERLGHSANTVLSHQAWQRWFASDPDALGTTLPVPGKIAATRSSECFRSVWICPATPRCTSSRWRTTNASSKRT